MQLERRLGFDHSPVASDADGRGQRIANTDGFRQRESRSVTERIDPSERESVAHGAAERASHTKSEPVAVAVAKPIALTKPIAIAKPVANARSADGDGI